MFRKMITLVALAFSVSAFSASTTVDTSGLTEAQIAEIKAIAAKKVAEAAPSGRSRDEKITAGVVLATTWGTQAAAAAEGFSRALGIAARELNVTINDFLKSPAGILTAALIIWKIAGASLLHAMFSLIILTVGLTMVCIIYNRLFTRGYERVEYSYFFGAVKGTKMVRVPKSFQDLNKDGEWLAFWVMILTMYMTLLFAGSVF